MLQLIVVGRGGQGAQTAGNMLAQTFFDQGDHVQAFSTYGGARRGTPVFSFIRVDDAPIRVRCNIDKPNALLCFDDSLLNAQILSYSTEETLLVVNSSLTVAFCRWMASVLHSAMAWGGSSIRRCSAP